MEKKILKKYDRIRVCLKIFYLSNNLQIYVLDLTTLRQYSFFFFLNDMLTIRYKSVVCYKRTIRCVRRVTLLSLCARDGNIYKHFNSHVF